jgi:hypothetical protein
MTMKERLGASLGKGGTTGNFLKIQKVPQTTPNFLEIVNIYMHNVNILRIF